MTATACNRALCCLLIVVMSGCGSASRIYRDEAVGPGAAVGIGDEVIIRQAFVDDETRMIVSAKSFDAISGHSVDDVDTVTEIPWRSITYLEVRNARYSTAENAALFYVALLLFGAATADVWEKLFDFDD